MIDFKEETDRPDFEKIHPQLFRIVAFMEAYAKIVLNRDTVTVTSIYRKDASTHQQKTPFRFIDLRVFKDLPMEENEKLRSIVNLTFPYGLKSNGSPGETIIHLDHGTFPHFHVQISSRWLHGHSI